MRINIKFKTNISTDHPIDSGTRLKVLNIISGDKVGNVARQAILPAETSNVEQFVSVKIAFSSPKAPVRSQIDPSGLVEATINPIKAESSNPIIISYPRPIFSTDLVLHDWRYESLKIDWGV